MGKIVISTNMSLDGVVEDPDGKEGSPHGGWFNKFGGDDLAAWTQLELDEAKAFDAMLLGRVTDAWFASRWLSREGEFADLLNGMPKYVVSNTITETAWSNGTVLKGDVVEEVSALKQSVSGDILVYSSYQLERALIEHDLVDEIRLVVFPVVVGGGERLFGQTTDMKGLRLISARTIGAGLPFLTYEVSPKG